MSDRVVFSSGKSMFPLIREGMRVTLRLYEGTEGPQVGDVVAFQRDGVMILHRIIARRGDQFREKGDNTRVGSWTDGKDCLGRAVLAESKSWTVRLDVPRDSIRVRILTRLSRIEDLVFGFLQRGAGRVWSKRETRPISLLAHMGSIAAMPLRALALPLLSIYRREPRSEDAVAFDQLVWIFRFLAGREVPVEWEGMQGLVVTHGLEALAASARDEFRAMRHRAAFIHMNALLTLREVVAAFDAPAIPYLTLKGPPLALALYGDGARRPYVDVDVFVPVERRDEAMAALARAGYRARGTPLQQAAVKRGHFHIVFDPPEKNRVPVELHWGLVDRANLYRLDEKAIQSRRRLVRVDDLEVATLAPEDELLYLLLHIAKHGLFNGLGVRKGAPPRWFCRPVTGNRLIWFMDIQRFLEQREEELDWEMARENSNRWNISDEIFQSLEILNRLMPDDCAARALGRLGFPTHSVVGSVDVRVPHWVMN